MDCFGFSSGGLFFMGILGYEHEIPFSGGGD